MGDPLGDPLDDPLDDPWVSDPLRDGYNPCWDLWIRKWVGRTAGQGFECVDC